MSEPSGAVLPQVGDVIDRKYRLVRLLGQGGMGAVYAAQHTTLGSSWAVKVMLADPSNAEAIARFKNEGRAAANIHNEHVVQVVDVDEEGGFAYMVLELLEGEDLAQLLDRSGGRLPPMQVVQYVMQGLTGVGAAHAQGIVHRDLKPSNLFLAKRRDGTSIIKVLDFGISKAGQAQSALAQTPAARTSTKAMLGSPLYMSPEQLRSSKSVDARADIWAVGVILYESLTGKLPFMGENLGELFAAILEQEPPPLVPLVSEIPLGLQAIVLKCLQRKPENRYQNVAELQRDLTPFANGTAASPYAMSAIAPPSAPMQIGTALIAPEYNPAPAIARAVTGPQALTPQGMMAGPGAVSQPTYPSPQAVQTGHAGQTGHPHHPGPIGPVGASTGSGVHVPIVRGTVPIGSTTPQPGAGWQQTMGSVAGVPRSSTPMILGICAVLVLIGGGLGGWAVFKKKPTAGDGGGAASVTAANDPPPPVVSSAPPHDPPAIASASSAPSASSASSGVASASAAPAAHPAGGAVVVNAKNTKPVPPPPTPAKPPPPEQPVAKPATADPIGNLKLPPSPASAKPPGERGGTPVNSR